MKPDSNGRLGGARTLAWASVRSPDAEARPRDNCSPRGPGRLGDATHRMHEGCVRLDRVQPVHSSLLDAKPVQLSEAVLDALTAWYGTYLNGPVSGRISAYRDEALAQLP